MISFGIKDVIDILLVAFLLYYIYRLMKRSSAANIFTGIIIFILVQYKDEGQFEPFHVGSGVW